MLIESEMKKLAENKEYTKVFNYFHDEYTEMLKNFLERHEVAIKDEDCLIDYIVKTRFFMPKFTGYTIPITHCLYDENAPEEAKYMLLMESYQEVYEAFRKMFMNDNPFLRITAMDLIKYAYLVEGRIQRRNTVAKMIPNSILITLCDKCHKRVHSTKQIKIYYRKYDHK